jgi:AraC-like DNA-binding protein
MEFRYFQPSAVLQPYIRHYYLFESESNAAFEDTVFPSGDMEMIFNLGTGVWKSLQGDKFLDNPATELWGQITRPLAIRSSGKHCMLGVRFFTHSASCFLDDQIGIFNDQVSNLEDIIGKPVRSLHSKLLDINHTEKRIEVLDKFLTNRLLANQQKSERIHKVGHILSSIKNDPAENNITRVASSHGITTRYLQKLIYQHTGLSPKSFDKISRFKKSLALLGQPDMPLTSVAYDSGYFDQSHFIRDFKSFTGITPSAYLESISAVNQLLLR